MDVLRVKGEGNEEDVRRPGVSRTPREWRVGGGSGSIQIE